MSGIVVVDCAIMMLLIFVDIGMLDVTVNVVVSRFYGMF